MRAFGIWVTGLLASLLLAWAMLYGVTGNYDAGFIGGVGAMLAFTCARLWAGERRG